ncbi:MAG TPA: hypothetical protein VE503_13035 [Ornithinibacter sp.]|nr:hypothetical protein [Ornithinibacter sp.]
MTGVSSTPAGLADTGRRRRVVTRVLLLGALLAAGSWRASIGLDLGDGSHVVGLGMRLAQGDLPLADEMNFQALGSLPAAPFVWLWLSLVGDEGVILASRLTFVVLTALAGWVSWQALRPMVGPAVAGGAVVAALIPAPYNITTISYNTSPNLLLLVAASAGARAAQSTDGRWAAGAGVAAVLAALCNPVMAPAAGLTLVLVILLSRRRQVLVGCSLGVAASAALVATWLIVVVGVEHVRSTLDFTAAYQAQRISHSTRLHNAWEFYATTFSSTPVLIAVALAVMASLPPLAIRLRALLVAVVPLVLAPTAVREIPEGAQSEVPMTGMTSGVLALVLVGVLLLPAAVWAVQMRGARRPGSGADSSDRVDRLEPRMVEGTSRADAAPAASLRPAGLGALLVVGVLPLAVQAPLISSLTSSSPQWGAVAGATAPALFAVLVATGSLARTASAGWWVVAAVTSTAVLFATHTIQPFRDLAPWRLSDRVDSGAATGILASSEMHREAERVEKAVASCQRDGDGLLAYGVPAAFAFADGPMDTNILWLGAFRGANQAAVDWIERTDREPACLLVSTTYLDLAGPDPGSRTASDPLLRWIEPRYRVVPQPFPEFVVMRRLGQ